MITFVPRITSVIICYSESILKTVLLQIPINSVVFVPVNCELPITYIFGYLMAEILLNHQKTKCPAITDNIPRRCLGARTKMVRNIFCCSILNFNYIFICLKCIHNK